MHNNISKKLDNSKEPKSKHINTESISWFIWLIIRNPKILIKIHCEN